MKPKVFGIGFHKTGTTSLKRALRQLGYSVTGPDHVYDAKIAEKLHDITRKLSRKFDAFQDNPWPLVYREMDELYPDAKFILTFRSTEKWIASVTKHFGEEETPMRALIYGTDRAMPGGHADHYRSVYDAHNRDVRAYFADRPGKLLEMNFEQGSDWDDLCPFLGHETPDTPFSLSPLR